MNNTCPIPTLRSTTDGLMLEKTLLSTIAERYGTPVYIYSKAALCDAWQGYMQAFTDFPVTICYAVKVNSNLSILRHFAASGAGFDIVSGGELARVIAAGGDPAKIVFSGVGKTITEIRYALQTGIRCFNIESEEELQRIAGIAAAEGKIAPIALRINPDVNPLTHPYISTGLKNNKFGIAWQKAPALYRQAAANPHLKITGIACHIGSQILDPGPQTEATVKLLQLVDTLAEDGIRITHLDLGGGMGIRYTDEKAPSAADYYSPILKALEGRSEQISIEPGRSLVGNAGLLLTRIEYLKSSEDKHFAVVDAAMNDLIRPALYQAKHRIVPVTEKRGIEQVYDIVGPVCESSDFLAKDQRMVLESGDLLAVLSAGAYCMSMSSNYNSRPRVAEVMIDGDQCQLIRARESIESLFALELPQALG